MRSLVLALGGCTHRGPAIPLPDALVPAEVVAALAAHAIPLSTVDPEADLGDLDVWRPRTGRGAR